MTADELLRLLDSQKWMIPRAEAIQTIRELLARAEALEASLPEAQQRSPDTHEPSLHCLGTPKPTRL